MGRRGRAGGCCTRWTEAGRAELPAWFAWPVGRVSPPRDELAIKLVMAVAAPGVDVREVVQAQRCHVAQALDACVRQRVEALARAHEHPDEMARLTRRAAPPGS
ncbi:hypothetical protein ABT121_26660 [Streptomyces sp. NPDC001928]|uniref:hypothetical protein n=1 Tax=Streptomyces sp. NPDC001928 TaxID=3154404 RepID=UPI00332A56EE